MAVDTLDLGLPHLTVVDTIGRGGFSVVYKAVDTKLNRPVAVKVLTGVANQADLERFDQECQIHGPLSTHPNIVTIHDAGFTPTGSPFLVMEYLDAGSLSDHLEANGPLPWHQAIEWMVPICDAVDTAHRMGVLHRDIKPANILVSNDGPKLADFGIACVTDATSPQFAVSWLHAPPEAELNRRDERSDVYSLASTMFQLLAGAAPYWRDGDESLAALLARMATEPVPHLSPAVAPAWLDQLLQRALAKDPAARPATAADLRAALVAGLAGPGTGSGPAVVPGPGHGVAGFANPSTDDRATIVLPTATEILPAVALHPATAEPNPARHPRLDVDRHGGTVDSTGGWQAQSGPAGGGPLVGGGPLAVSVDTGSPTTTGWSTSAPGHPHPQPQPRQGADAMPRSRRRSKKLPVAVAVVAIATAGFFLSPAWAALASDPGPGAATTESSTSTTVASDGTSPTAPPTTADSDSSPSTAETTDPTESTVSTDSSETTDTSETTDPTDTSETTDPTDPPPPPPPADIEVPHVADLTPDEAEAVLTEEGFDTIDTVTVASETVAEGLVVETDPTAGSVVDPDTTITIVVSSGPETVTIPDLELVDPGVAAATLADLGLDSVVVEVDVPSGSPDIGLVTATDPDPGTSVPLGTTVTLVVAVEESGPVVTIDPEIVNPTITLPPTTLDLAP